MGDVARCEGRRSGLDMHTRVSNLPLELRWTPTRTVKIGDPAWTRLGIRYAERAAGRGNALVTEMLGKCRTHFVMFPLIVSIVADQMEDRGVGYAPFVCVNHRFCTQSYPRLVHNHRGMRATYDVGTFRDNTGRVSPTLTARSYRDPVPESRVQRTELRPLISRS